MIVLDEQLLNPKIADAIARWSRSRVHEISGLLRRVFRLPEFRTKAVRVGKVALVDRQQVQYYQVGDSQRYSLPFD